MSFHGSSLTKWVLESSINQLFQTSKVLYSNMITDAFYLKNIASGASCLILTITDGQYSIPLLVHEEQAKIQFGISDIDTQQLNSIKNRIIEVKKSVIAVYNNHNLYPYIIALDWNVTNEKSKTNPDIKDISQNPQLESWIQSLSHVTITKDTLPSSFFTIPDIHKLFDHFKEIEFVVQKILILAYSKPYSNTVEIVEKETAATEIVNPVTPVIKEVLNRITPIIKKVVNPAATATKDTLKPASAATKKTINPATTATKKTISPAITTTNETLKHVTKISVTKDTLKPVTKEAIARKTIQPMIQRSVPTATIIRSPIISSTTSNIPSHQPEAMVPTPKKRKDSPTDKLPSKKAKTDETTIPPFHDTVNLLIEIAHSSDTSPFDRRRAFTQMRNHSFMKNCVFE